MPQLLHLVFGGELVDPQGTEFRDVDDIDIVGIFPNYATAYAAWKAKAQGTWTTPTCATSSPTCTGCTTRRPAGRRRSWASAPARAWPAVANRSLLLGLYLALSRRAGGFARADARAPPRGRQGAPRAPARAHGRGRARPARRARSSGSTPRASARRRRCSRCCAGCSSRAGEVTCLVTTVTVTSAEFLEDRLPEHCIHQFAPVDVLPWVERFLDHWRPDLAVWTESELWPAMIHATHARGIPMLLINARISTRSYRRWRLLGGFAAGADRPLRPHPRPGRAGRRAARGPRRRSATA